MIRFAAVDLICAEDLLQQHDPREAVRERHIRERERLVGAVEHSFAKAETAADHECDRARAAVLQRVQVRGEGFRGVPPPADRSRSAGVRPRAF